MLAVMRLTEFMERIVAFNLVAVTAIVGRFTARTLTVFVEHNSSLRKGALIFGICHLCTSAIAATTYES